MDQHSQPMRQAGAAAPSTMERIIRYPLVLMVIAFAMFIAAAILANKISELLPKAPGTPIDLVRALIFAACVVAAYWLFCRYVEREPVRDFAAPGWAAEVGAGLAFGALLFSLVAAIVYILGGYRIVGQGDVNTIWAALAMAVASGVGEELLFRGILFRFIEKVGGSGIALAVTSGLFGLAHIFNPAATMLSSLAIAVEAGVLLGGIYMLTRRLWAAIGLHAAWNFTQGWIFAIPVSGVSSRGIVVSQLSGPELLTGGAFGLEASVVAMVVATSAGILMLFLAARRGNVVRPPWRRGPATAGDTSQLQ